MSFLDKFQISSPEPLVAAPESRAERSARVKLQWRDRYGRWVEMGRSVKFKLRLPTGKIASVIGEFIGGQDGFGRIKVSGDPNVPNGVYHVSSANGSEVIATLSPELLKGRGITPGLDAKGNAVSSRGAKDIQDLETITFEPELEETAKPKTKQKTKALAAPSINSRPDPLRKKPVDTETVLPLVNQKKLSVGEKLFGAKDQQAAFLSGLMNSPEERKALQDIIPSLTQPSKDKVDLANGWSEVDPRIAFANRYGGTLEELNDFLSLEPNDPRLDDPKYNDVKKYIVNEYMPYYIATRTEQDTVRSLRVDTYVGPDGSTITREYSKTKIDGTNSYEDDFGVGSHHSVAAASKHLNELSERFPLGHPVNFILSDSAYNPEFQQTMDEEHGEGTAGPAGAFANDNNLIVVNTNPDLIPDIGSPTTEKAMREYLIDAMSDGAEFPFPYTQEEIEADPNFSYYRHMIAHEYGHLYDATHFQIQDYDRVYGPKESELSKKYKELYSDPANHPSTYGGTNALEFFAEHFAHYAVTGKGLNPDIAKDIDTAAAPEAKVKTKKADTSRRKSIDDWSGEQLLNDWFGVVAEYQDRSDNLTDHAMATAEMQGMDGAPQALSDAEFDAFDGEPLFRGVNSAESKQRFYEDANWIGSGGNGTGIYTSTARSHAGSYANHDDSKILDLKLRPDAVIMDGYELEDRRQADFDKAMSEGNLLGAQLASGDLGIYATAIGIDGYRVEIQGFPSVVLTNREAVVARKSDATPSPQPTPENTRPTALEGVDYKLSHTAPGPDYGASLDKITDIYPEDILDPAVQMQYYGTGNRKADSESFAVVNSIKGNPEADVTIYRAVPDGVHKINPSDWVSLSPTYANEHLEGPMGGRGHVISKQVKAKEIYTDSNSINEFGWQPDPKTYDPTKPADNPDIPSLTTFTDNEPAEANNPFTTNINADNEYTGDQYDAIKWYTDTGYEAANAHLRNNALLDDDKKFMTDQLVDLVSQSEVSYDTVVYRGMAITESERYQEVMKLVPGDELTDTGLGSHSTDIDRSLFYANMDLGPVQGRALFRVKVPKGSKAFGIPDDINSYRGESEVLIAPNTDYKVTAVSNVNGVRVIDVEITSQKENKPKNLATPNISKPAVNSSNKEMTPISERKGSEGLKETLDNAFEAAKEARWDSPIQFDEETGDIIEDPQREAADDLGYMGKFYKEFVQGWPSGFDFGNEVNAALRKILSGETKLDPNNHKNLSYDENAAVAGLELIQASPTVDETMYRGIRTTQDVVDSYVPGESIELPFSSFSVSRNETKQYWSPESPNNKGGKIPVEYELEAGSRSIPLIAFDSQAISGEFVTAGTFEVVSVEPQADEYSPVKVKIRHVETFDPDLQDKPAKPKNVATPGVSLGDAPKPKPTPKPPAKKPEAPQPKKYPTTTARPEPATSVIKDANRKPVEEGDPVFFYMEEDFTFEQVKVEGVYTGFQPSSILGTSQEKDQNAIIRIENHPTLKDGDYVVNTSQINLSNDDPEFEYSNIPYQGALQDSGSIGNVANYIALTRDQRVALTDYTSGFDYALIAQLFRDNPNRSIQDLIDDPNIDESDKMVIESVQNLESAINSSPLQKDTVLYRGIEIDGDLESIIQAFKPGEYFDDASLQSTSTDPATADRFITGDGIIFEIQAPEGAPALYVPAFATELEINEQEVLLPRNSRLKIVSVGEIQEGENTETFSNTKTRVVKVVVTYEPAESLNVKSKPTIQLQEPKYKTLSYDVPEFKDGVIIPPQTASAHALADIGTDIPSDTLEKLRTETKALFTSDPDFDGEQAAIDLYKDPHVYDSLTKKGEYAIQYIDSSLVINKGLRTGDYSTENSDQVKSLDESMLISPSLPAGMTVYRMMKLSRWEQLDLKPGQIINDRAYMSTSTTDEYAKLVKEGDLEDGHITQIPMRIVMPQNTSGVDISTISRFPFEDEYLLPRNTALRFLGWDSNGYAVFERSN